jgi:MYXO-CTERM domain-containing protein
MKYGTSALVALGFLTVTTAATAQQLRFGTTAPGGVAATGNTLGLSKDTNLNGPGIRDSIGTFLTLGGGQDDSPANPANPWPQGTTSNWTQNGSSAVLTLPGEVSVLYAELLWGGSFQYGAEDVTAFLETPVKLEFGGSALDVAPDPATALTVSGVAATGFNVRYYLRSADVTAFVQGAGPGMYSVSGVPATQETAINSLNAAGWTLVVAYRDESAPTRNLSVFVGGSFVDENSQQDYLVSGFCAPPIGPVTGTAVVSTIEGDANLTGDQLLIAPDAAGPFVQLSGPNNPANNFFCSQMNDAAGVLDPQGTFGAANHDAVAGVNMIGGRQGWDVTTVPLSSQDGKLLPGQKSAVLRTITTGDSYMPILASLAIDVNAPQLTGQDTKLTANPQSITLFDTVTLDAVITNTGQVDAQALSLALELDQSLSLVSITSDGVLGDINGALVDAADLATGIDEGTLAPGETRKVQITVDVSSEPASKFQYLLATWSYGYEACVGEPLLTETLSRSTVLTYEPPVGTGGSGGAGGGGSSAGGSGGAGGGAGGSGADGGSGGAADGGSGGDAGGEGGQNMADSAGCGCRTEGSSPAETGIFWSLAALGLTFARRRRRP